MIRIMLRFVLLLALGASTVAVGGVSRLLPGSHV
jgi:hypothetical protein